MSSTSPNFGFVLATTSDVVSVTSHIANPLSSIDAILAVAHTGTGQLKASLTLTTPVLVNPVMSGTASGSTLLVANTGRFNTITATGGALTLNTLTVGTYSYPATAGGAGDVLTIVTGNALFVTPAPGTGAAADLSNLVGPVAINTSLNTFSAGFVTVARVIATSGALTGLTSFQATTGTFAGLLTALGTVTANVVNCTGGTITAGGLSIGTYSFPATVGTSSQVLQVSAGNLIFGSGPHKSNVVWEWCGGNTSLSSNNGGIIFVNSASSFINFAISTTASQMYLAAVGSKTILESMYLHNTAVNTMKFSVYAVCQTTSGTVTVIIGTASATASIVGGGTGTWIESAALNVSTLTPGTLYPMTYAMASEAANGAIHARSFVLYIVN